MSGFELTTVSMDVDLGCAERCLGLMDGEKGLEYSLISVDVALR
jgi:hypothetical protein